MKKFPLSIAVLITTFPVFPAGATGKEALSTLRKSVGESAGKRVVQLVGVHGQHQPAEWRVVVQEGSGTDAFQTYTVEGESVVKQETVRKDYRKQLPGAAIPRGDIRIDSGDAFVIADREAKEAKVGFDSLNYELRCPELSETPVWYVDLRDAHDRMVGRIFVSAKSGEVLRRLWFPQADEGDKIDEAGKDGEMVESKKSGARRKGYLSENMPQEQPAIAPGSAPAAKAEKKGPFGVIGKGMARIANPLRGKSE